MAAYTITTSAVEEAALAAVVAEANAAIDAQNAELAAQKPPGKPLPHLDKATYLDQRVHDVLMSWGNTHQQAIAATALGNYQSLTAATQSQILGILGMSAYSVLPIQQQMEALSQVGLQKFLALPVAQQNQIFTLAGLTA